MLGRLVIDKPELEERIARMGIKDKNKIYEAEDLAPGKQLIFAATGVTEGSLMKGVRFFGEGHADIIGDPDPAHRESAFHRQHPPGEGAGCEGEVRVSAFHISSRTSCNKQPRSYII